MDSMRSIARWALALLIGLAVSVWIFVAVTNATIGNRGVVKSWLASSGAYETALPGLLRVVPSEQADSQIISPQVLQQALVNTFDAGYLQKNVNVVIDATYNWLEGSSKTITFSIPVQEKVGDFSTNLAALIEPKIKGLPTCNSKLGNPDPTHLSCLPAGTNTTDYAKQLTQTPEGNNFLGTPLTEKMFGDSFQPMGWLPVAVGWMKTLLIALPIAALVLAALYVLATPNKLKGLGHVGQQLVFGSVITLVGGLLLWGGSGTVDVSPAVEAADQAQKEAIVALVNPLVQTILPDIGRAFSIYSGVVVGVGVLLWLSAFLWRRHMAQRAAPVVPPANKEEAVLPTPKKIR